MICIGGKEQKRIGTMKGISTPSIFLLCLPQEKEGKHWSTDDKCYKSSR